MHSRWSIGCLVAWLWLGACECGSAPSLLRTAQPQTATSEGQAERPLPPPPTGTPLGPDQLGGLTPDTFAGFVAEGAAELRDMPLPNGGKMTGVRRTYRRGPQSLELELTDALHAPAVTQLITARQGAERKTDKSEFRGASVGGNPAIVQWTAPSTAIVNMLVAGRFLANFKISPVESAELALTAAGSLPVAEIVKLAGTTAAPSAPVPVE